MFSKELLKKAEALLQACREREWRIATAESCTGGMVTTLLTEIPGSSEVVDRGYITYANEAKIAMLGVPELVLKEQGAVSEAVARAMAEGVIAHAGVDLSVAITGVAGPGGGSEAKPVGTVHIASASLYGPTQHEEYHFTGNRQKIRLQAVEAAIEMMAKLPL